MPVGEPEHHSHGQILFLGLSSKQLPEIMDRGAIHPSDHDLHRDSEDDETDFAVKAFSAATLQPGESYPVWRTIRGHKVRILDRLGRIDPKTRPAWMAERVKDVGGDPKSFKVAGEYLGQMTRMTDKELAEHTKGHTAEQVTLETTSYYEKDGMPDVIHHRVKVANGVVVAGRYKGFSLKQLRKGSQWKENTMSYYDPETGHVESMIRTDANGRKNFAVRNVPLVHRYGNRLYVMLHPDMKAEAEALKAVGARQESANRWTIQPQRVDELTDALGGLALTDDAHEYLKAIAGAQEQSSESIADVTADDIDFSNYPEFTTKYIANLAQRRSVAWWLKKRRGMVSAEMGVGKTLASVMAFAHVRKEERENGAKGNGKMLVVCPKSVGEQFIASIRENTKFRVTSGNEDFSDSDIHVVDYNEIKTTGLKGKFDQPWSMLAVDEAHKTKNPDSQQSQEVNTISQLSGSVMYMSATPIDRSPEEAYNLIQGMSPGANRFMHMSEREFKSRYCEIEPRTGRVIGIKRDMLPEFRDVLSDHILYMQADDYVDRPSMPDLPQAAEKIDMHPVVQKAYRKLNQTMNQISESVRERMDEKFGEGGYTEDQFDAAVSGAKRTITINGKKVQLSGSTLRAVLEELESAPEYASIKLSGAKDSERAMVLPNLLKDPNYENVKVKRALDLAEQHLATRKEYRSPEGKTSMEQGGQVIFFARRTAPQKALLIALAKRYGAKAVNGLVTTELRKDRAYMAQLEKLGVGKGEMTSANLSRGRNLGAARERIQEATTQFALGTGLTSPKPGVEKFMVLAGERAREGVSISTGSMIVHMDMDLTPGAMLQRSGRIRRVNSNFREQDQRILLSNLPEGVQRVILDPQAQHESVDETTYRRNMERLQTMRESLVGTDKLALEKTGVAGEGVRKRTKPLRVLHGRHVKAMKKGVRLNGRAEKG